ncbi:response regulator [Oleidesulfovibrio sp.]|uniref:response regulator n=1 Tax=Oleidesulfovibrio sp. TaxID=2909707 RepID=UPI003A88AE2E
MSVIAIHNGIYCHEEQYLSAIREATGYSYVTDDTVVDEAARRSGISASRLRKAFDAKPSIFNSFTNDRERARAWFRLIVAEHLAKDNMLFMGFTAMMVPTAVKHALRVCLIGNKETRITNAAAQGIGEGEAQKTLRARDSDAAEWVKHLTGNTDPWAAELYDIVIPVDKSTPLEAAALVKEMLGREAVKPDEASRKYVQDVLLAAQVEVQLASKGHFVQVVSEAGVVTLTVNGDVSDLERLGTNLRAAVIDMPGVEGVKVVGGRDIHAPSIYRQCNFELPNRVLVVDDERDFAQTLSQRLEVREMGSAVAYDGESALEIVERDQPEVMILDLKMPGVDGKEVLRRVKESRPEVEVIILTGQGSDSDRAECMKLGAFAYLEKPVDIEQLSSVLLKANTKARQNLKSA